MAWWRRKSVTGMWESTVRGGASGRVQSGRDVWRVREGKRKGEWNRSQKAKVQKGR